MASEDHVEGTVRPARPLRTATPLPGGRHTGETKPPRPRSHSPARELLIAGLIWVSIACAGVFYLAVTSYRHSRAEQPGTLASAPPEPTNGADARSAFASPHQVFRGVRLPPGASIHDGSISWHNGQFSVFAMEGLRVEIRFQSQIASDTDGDRLWETIQLLTAIVDNSLPEWPGAGKSVCSATAALQGRDILNLYNGTKHIYMRTSGGYCEIRITDNTPRTR